MDNKPRHNIATKYKLCNTVLDLFNRILKKVLYFGDPRICKVKFLTKKVKKKNPQFDYLQSSAHPGRHYKPCI